MPPDRNAELVADLPPQAAPERVDIPARLRTAERRQVELRAICLDDLVPEKHRGRQAQTQVDGSTRRVSPP